MISGAVIGVAAGALAALYLAGTATAQQKGVVIGGMCDRTGPTQVNGAGICPGIQDYFDLVNSKGGIEGYKIKYEEIDHEYKVPPAVEAYQREKGDGATSILVYGSPQVQAFIRSSPSTRSPAPRPVSESPRRPMANAILICFRSRRPTSRRVPQPSSTSRTN